MNPNISWDIISNNPWYGWDWDINSFGFNPNLDWKNFCEIIDNNKNLLRTFYRNLLLNKFDKDYIVYNRKIENKNNSTFRRYFKRILIQDNRLYGDIIKVINYY